MTAVLDVLVRSSLLLAVGLVALAFLRHHSAAVRHAVLAASLVGAASLPLMGPALPSWTLPLPEYRSVDEKPAVAVVSLDSAGADPARRHVPGSAPNETGSIWPVCLASIWALGALTGLALLARALRRVYAAVDGAAPLDTQRWQSLLRQECPGHTREQVEVRMVQGLPAPATCGWRRPSILLPSAARHWDDDRMRLVLRHELAHVARRDWAVQLAAEVLRAVYWWNPLFWHAAARLRRESEVACDDSVLETGVTPADYASHLIAIARVAGPAGFGWPGVVGMSHPSLLERRVRIMLASSRDRRPLSAGRLVGVAGLVASLAVALATVHAAQSVAELRGTVYDATGAVVPEVALTLTHDGTPPLEAYTNADGSFSYPAVAAGTYALAARLPGFAPLTAQFTLASSSDWDRAITLQLGTVKEQISIVASRDTQPPPAQAASPAAVRVGGNIKAPLKLKDVRAIYPSAMRAEGREGEVTLEAIIDTDGAVRSVRVLGAHVHPDFALAAAEAVKQWRFTATLLNGRPVEVVMTVATSFRLSDQSRQ